MEGSKVIYNLNIIDTPGFKDTRQDFDKRITTQIEEVFNDAINHLDAILIVVPNSISSLTEGQRHVFTSILNMFGEDIAKNVFVALTHFDGGTADHALHVLRDANVPYNDFFKFNNSNVLSEFETDSKQTEIWNDRTQSFDELFEKLETTQKTTVTSSIKVMRARANLEIKLSELKESISEQAQVIANYIKDYKHVLEAISKGCPENKENAKYHALVPVTSRRFHFLKSLNCVKCERTCHKMSFLSGDVVISDGKCRVCECDFSDHMREHYAYSVRNELQLLSGQAAIDNQKMRQQSFSKFYDTLVDIQNLIRELKDNALAKNTLDLSGYVQCLIKHEASKETKGYEMRVQILQKVLEHIKANEFTKEITIDSLL